MLLRSIIVILISLWCGSVAYADKSCPVDGEVYPDSVQYCIQHGNRLVPKKEASTSGSARIYLFGDSGLKESFDFEGFDSDCDGYGTEGSKYTENGVSVIIPWRDFVYLLPEHGRAKLKNGYTIESESLRRANCNSAKARVKRKAKAITAGHDREKEETTDIGISRIEIISFDEKGLEEGRVAKEGIAQKQVRTEIVLDGGKKPPALSEERRTEEAASLKHKESTVVAEDIKRQTEKEEKGRADTEKTKMANEILAGEFVFVKGGCFRMGDAFGDGRPDELPIHEVCLDDFFIGKYEVTQGQWQAVMGYNPAYHKNGDSYPVEQVSWNDAQGFIRKLNEKTGQFHRLPTEAEWEFAARSGGKKEKYPGSGDVDAVAWYQSTAKGMSHQVGTKAPNGIDIHDMGGNVWEWVQDWYGSGYYGSSAARNPKGPSTGTHRVARGGGWSAEAESCRTTDREYLIPAGGNNFMGFRLVRQK